MSAQLIYEIDRKDENGVQMSETHANYASIEEAMLQAAHDIMVGGTVPLRIEVDGKKVKGPADFKKAVTAYRKALNKGLSMDDSFNVIVDTSGHAKAMKGI